jgi:4-cresol dehydrogenase (hydroxylating)
MAPISSRPAPAPVPEPFLAACRTAIGAAHVSTAPHDLAAWSLCTFPWSGRPLAILSPGSAEEALACLRLAGEHGCPLHPVSRGRSWGLGSRSPPQDAVMLDLSRLDRILEIDLTFGTVRIEPGVTFSQLQDELIRRGAEFHLPAFGGPPGASVLANALDRGEGSGAFGDRFGQLWDLDIALTTGERLRSGHGRFENPTLAPLHARPVGPLIEGLFSQASFGCVLSGCIGLAPTARHGCYLAFDIGASERLPPFVEAVRGLVRDRVVEVHDAFFWDGAKRIASSGIAADLAEPPPPEAFRDWLATIAITANHEMMYNCRKALVIETLLPFCASFTIEEEEPAARNSGLRGFSDGANVTSCYWAKAALPDGPLDPDRDRCGFLWLCPVVPLTGLALARLAQLTQEAARRFGIFIMTGAEAATERACNGYVSLAWDRDVAGADARAMAAHAMLMEAFTREGFHPYRPTLPATAAMPPSRGDWAPVLARLRHALDPAGVLATGRVAGL